MSRFHKYEDEEKLALREKNWNPRFVLEKIPRFDAYNDVNYLSLNLFKSKLRYEEKMKKINTKTKYNDRIYSSKFTKSKSYGKPKIGNTIKNNYQKENKFTSIRLYLKTNNDNNSNNRKKISNGNSYNSHNFPYQGTLTAQNVAGSNLFKFVPDYKNQDFDLNYIDYICKEDQEIADEYDLLKDLWEKLGVTDNYIKNFIFLLNSKYKNHEEILDMLKSERKQLKQFRVEFMKVLSEINKRENKILDLKMFIKIYKEILEKEKKYENISDEKLKDIGQVNKEKVMDDIHDCLKSMRLKTINTVNAIQKFKRNYDHLFNNKISLEFIKEQYGYNENYLKKLKNDLDFLRDSAINTIYHFSEKGGDPFLLCISDLCGNKNDIKKYRQIRISEDVLAVVKKFMFYLEQQDIIKLTPDTKENYKEDNNIEITNSCNDFNLRSKNKFSKNYFNNNDYILNEKIIFNNNYHKPNIKNKNDINLLSNNFKGNLEKEKLKLKAQNEYQNVFFNTEEDYRNKNINITEKPNKTLLNNKDNFGNKYLTKGMTSKQLVNHLERYSKIQNELFPSTSKDKIREKVKNNIIKNIEDRMKKVENEFKLKMEEKFKKEENKIKEEEKKIQEEKEKIEKLCKEEEEERKKKEEYYLKMEKEIEERKKKDKKIIEENEKLFKREKEVIVKEMHQKLLGEVEERLKKEDERKIQFKKEMINEAEKREKERKNEKERIRTEDYEKIKRGEVIVDLREKKENEKKNKNGKKSEKTESKKEDESKENDEEDDEEEEEESDEEDNEGSKKNNKNKFTSENDEYTNSDEKINNKKRTNQKESSSNEDISEDIEEES